ncbi:MAG: type II toxin-antitoxin system VapC family toxin [Actinomycetota bacterium]
MGTWALIQGILDTSVLIAQGRRDFEERQGDYAISVLSVAELHKGALRARSVRERAARIARLALVEQAFEAIPIDRRVAVKFGEIAATTQRLANRPHVIDGLIAATAIVLGVPVVTRDHDLDAVPGLEVVIV